MSENTKEIEKEVAAEVVLKPEWEVEKDNGFATIKVKEGNLFVATAKEHGITKGELEKVAKFKEKYLHAAVDAATSEVQRVMTSDKDIKEAVVTVPNGTGKSSVIKTHVLREKEYKIQGRFSKSGKDEIMKNTVVKTYVEAAEYNYPKAKRKKLEKAMYAAMCG